MPLGSSVAEFCCTQCQCHLGFPLNWQSATRYVSFDVDQLGCSCMQLCLDSSQFAEDPMLIMK